MRRYGWTLNAISGLLGNIDLECRFNPMCLLGSIETGAYGLVQWHNPSKLINWAEREGLDYRSGWTQLKRIIYEWENNLQWQFSGMTFDEFVHSTDTPENLAHEWQYHYEVSGGGDLPERQERARYWYDYFRQHPVTTVPIWLLFRMKQKRGAKRGSKFTIRI